MEHKIKAHASLVTEILFHNSNLYSVSKETICVWEPSVCTPKCTANYSYNYQERRLEKTFGTHPTQSGVISAVTIDPIQDCMWCLYHDMSLVRWELKVIFVQNAWGVKV